MQAQFTVAVHYKKWNLGDLLISILEYITADTDINSYDRYQLFLTNLAEESLGERNDNFVELKELT